jgi:hypothetical protein
MIRDLSGNVLDIKTSVADPGPREPVLFNPWKSEIEKIRVWHPASRMNISVHMSKSLVGVTIYGFT